MTKFDTSSALRPTIINVEGDWHKRSQTSLLTKPTSTTLNSTAVTDVRKRAFDLLDALTKSGVLAFNAAELHIVVAATHW
jgi:hypothetical protein